MKLPSLYDAFTRHQIYLEKLKVGSRGLFNTVADAITSTLATELARLRIRTMGQLRKVQLLGLVQRLKRIWSRTLAGFPRRTSEFLQSFMHADMTLTRSIMDKLVSNIVPKVAKLRMGVWATIRNAIIPASGSNLTDMMKNYTSAALTALVKPVNQAYANNQTTGELQDTIGKAESDGVLSNLARQAGAIINTAVQHVSTYAQTSIASLYLGSYQYVAVIDERTTDICRELDGKVFKYGLGPVPPQHINCRSKIVPVRDGDAGYGDISFSQWLDTQPSAIKNEVRNNRAANGSYRPSQGISLDEFANTLADILLGNPES